MANYEAVIKLIVNGEAALTAVKKEIDEIYKTIGKIEKSGILNSKAAEATLAFAKQHANEVERAARATANQIKQNEQRILQQSRLNAAVDLYERRLTQATNSGAAGLKKFEGQIAQIEAAFKFFKDRGNVKVVQALATELGRMVEYSNNVSRNERARAATLSQLRGFAKQLADYELRGLDTAKAREKFDQLAVVAGSNQLNEVKKYTEALVRQLQLLKEKASLQAQVAKDTAAVQGALGRLEEEQRQLENSKLDEKALQIQTALDKQAAAAAETAAQTAKLNQRQLEFTERTEAAARAANKQTAEFYRMQRIAKEVAELNRTAGPAQLLLPAAKPGSPLMSGGARSLITGPVERAGGMRTADEAAMALRYAQALQEQVRPLSQIEALYAGIAKEAFDMQQIKALPDTAMLNAAARGIKQLETAEDRRNRELEESAARLREVDRLEESRARRAGKLDKIQQYIDFREDRMGMANAGFGLQGPALPPRGAAGGVPALPPRTAGMFDVPPAKGLAGFLGKPGMTDALMGAGFPLLFGAGPGAILGGGAGGFLGGAMGAAGGPAGMALGIGLSAVGQILDQTIVKIADMGKAANELNMDKLRESIVYVNADLETSVRLLIEAGKTEEARALAVEETAAQLAVTPDVLQDINKATQTLNMEWNATLGAITGAVAILAEPFITVISDSLRIVRLIATGFNIVATFVRDLVKGAYDWFLRLFGIKEIADRIRAILGFVYEDEQQRVAALTAANDQLLRELQTQKQILALEAQRTLGRTDAEKQINAEITKQQAQIKIREESAQREREIRRNTAGLTSTEVELALSLNKTKETQALKEQAIKDLLVAQGLEIEANAKKYSLAAEAVQRQIDALERGNQVRQSEFAVEVALNDLYGAQLQRQYEIAGTAAERYRIALLQFQQQVKSADIEYRLALANNQILVEKAVLQTKIVELKYKELEAEREIALAQAAARGNTPDQIAAIAGSYDKALGVQKEVLQSSYEQLQATKQITINQNQVAKAVYQTKLIQAESALAQKLVSDEIGMSKRAADNLAYSLRVSAEQAYAVQQQTRAVVGVIEVGTQRTVIFAQAMSNVAAAANNAAYNIDRAFRAQLNLNAAQAAKPASAPPVNKAAQGAFWAGGFKAFAKGGMVTGPTLGLVGEGGESEYIIPESKMATASANYLAGGRGAGIMEGGGGTAPSINITTGPVVEFNGERYVTLRDLEKGMQQMAANIYSGLRTPAGRYATGVR